MAYSLVTAIGKSCLQRKFPMCLEQRREAAAFGQTPSLSAASVQGAAARFLPLCSATGPLVLVGLGKGQCSHGHSQDS